MVADFHGWVACATEGLGRGTLANERWMARVHSFLCTWAAEGIDGRVDPPHALAALTTNRHDERLFAVTGSTSSAVIEHTVTAPARAKHDQGLLLIGIFKLTKAIFFVAIAAGALHFIHHDLGESLDRVVKFLRFDAENRFVSLLLGKADLITHHRLRQISMGTAAYAVLCTIEGVGLMRRKVWAEYLTLWLSASFLPWEAYELLHHANLWRLGILLMNLLITLYLVWLLRRKRQRASDPA